jgi:hypothetical protein
MVLTKNLQWPVHRWFSVVNESINALLSRCHRSALSRSFEFAESAGDFAISRQFLIRGYAGWILPTAILPVRRSSWVSKATF